MMEHMTKACSQCSSEKPVSEFTLNGSRLRAACKVCVAAKARDKRRLRGDHVRAATRQYFQNNQAARDRRKVHNRAWRERVGKRVVRECDERSRYGITRRELGSACAICGSTKYLGIDHDHSCCPGPRSCGKCVRDVLCVSCNTLIGKLESNGGRMMAIVGYLTMWKQRVL